MTDLPASRHAVVILNPEAGRRGPVSTNVTATEETARALDLAGLRYELMVPDEPDAIPLLARAAVERGAELVVAAGGDGTVRMVASAVIGSRAVLGILPLGSVMNIARMLEIPRELDQAAPLLASAPPIEIDFGEVDGQRFFEGVSIGLSSEVFRFIDDLQQGQLGSPLDFLRTLRRYRPRRVRLLIDDRPLTARALAMVIANGPYVGAGLTVAPDARLDDGLLDVVLFRRFSRWDLFRHLVGIAFGRRRYHPRIMTLAGQHIRVEARSPLPVRADGNDLGTTPVEVRVIPRALRVIAGLQRPHPS